MKACCFEPLFTRAGWNAACKLSRSLAEPSHGTVTARFWFETRGSEIQILSHLVPASVPALDNACQVFSIPWQSYGAYLSYWNDWIGKKCEEGTLPLS